jgi:hypothetical protein
VEDRPDIIVCDMPTYKLLLEVRHPQARRIGNYIQAPGYKWRRWPKFSAGGFRRDFRPERLPR